MSVPTKPKSLHQRQKPLQITTVNRQEYENWYNTARWLQLREIQLMQNPLCQSCAPRVVEATEVDHIKPHRGNPVLMWDQANLQSLCASCHSVKTFEETVGYASLLTPKDLPDPFKKPLTVVCGPPASGKSVHVQNHAKSTDMVLDVNDTDRSDTPAFIARLRERNRLLKAYLYNETAHTRCWLVSELPTFKSRLYWSSKGASIVLVHPGVDLCLERAPHKREAILKWS